MAFSCCPRMALSLPLKLPQKKPYLSRIFNSPGLYSYSKQQYRFTPSTIGSHGFIAFTTSSSSATSFTQTLEAHHSSIKSVHLHAYNRNVIDVLEERGLIESITNESIRSACANPASAPVKVYCGFDPTAESLHLGNLLGLIVLSWFQRCGHVPVALLGGATARVGDPSGKSIERPTLDETTIEKNLEGVKANIEQVLKVKVKAAENFVGNTQDSVSGSSCHDDGALKIHPAIVMNNYEWWNGFSLLQFLRDVGKYARVGTMMAKESVKKRLESEEGMSFTEFSYQLLQGYDFVHLFENEGVSIQIGGSDQWGNITAGTDLIRKILQKEGAFGLTFPLLLKSDGSKFGKSESGAIWLTASMLSAYKFYQHLFATPDTDVITFLKRLTFLSIEEINDLELAMGKPDYVPNTAQRKLAEEVTRFVHGQEGLEEAIRATKALAPGGTTKLDWKSIEAIALDLPSFSASHSSVVGSPLIDVCVACGLMPSKGAVRRLIKQGGLYLNNEKVEDESKTVESEDVIDNKMMLLSAGKKNKMIIRMQ